MVHHWSQASSSFRSRTLMIGQAPIVDPYSPHYRYAPASRRTATRVPAVSHKCLKGADACGVRHPREHEAPAKPSVVEHEERSRFDTRAAEGHLL